MNKKVISNFMYQSLFQVLKILMPIVTVPIISKAFGPEGVGLFSYSNSIVQYFVILSSLGISLYGSKIIATSRDNKSVMNKNFNELFFIKILTTLGTILIYLIFVLFVSEDNILLYLIQGLNILAVLFDISWFFMGIEDFRKTSLANLLTQIIIFILILNFIHGPEDLLLYCLIQALGNIASFLIVWLFVKSYIKIAIPKVREMKKHIMPLMVYFIPQVGVLFYVNLNKTFLGLMGDLDGVGLYTNATNLTTICITLITTIDLVLLPRMSNLFANNQRGKMQEVLSTSIQIQLMLSIPTAIGLVAITSKLTPWFFGPNFDGINDILYIIAPLVIIIPFGMSLSRQFLMPVGKEKIYNFSILLGAISSLLLNPLLVPNLRVYGTVFAYVFSEVLVCIYRYLKTKKMIKIDFNLLEMFKYVISSMIMMVCIKLFSMNLQATVITTLIQVLTGIVSYIVSLLLLRSEMVRYLKNLLPKNKKKV